jgi:hypothetical protein
MIPVKPIHVPVLIFILASLAIVPVAADEVAVTITGQITVNGKVLSDGTILFLLDDDEFVGARIKGGSYKMTRVPAGQWRVAIESDEVPAKYAKKASPFVVVVQQGMNVFDFDLKKK